MRTYKGIITQLTPNQVFVFHSNLQGKHGRGSALQAIRFGAKYGVAKGWYEQSYGIITKDLTQRRHPSVNESFIKEQIFTLYEVAAEAPQFDFLVAYTETQGLNGYTPQQMSDMYGYFLIPNNILFEESFAALFKIL